MQGGEQQRFSSRAAFFLLVSIMFLTPLSPMAGLFASEAEAAAGTRHVYEFSDGSVEHIALFQGANPDMGASLSLPRGALGRQLQDGPKLWPMTDSTGFVVRKATSTTEAGT